MTETNEFFPESLRLPKVTQEDLNDLSFVGKRLDLQVYHLAYRTKKLKKCTHRRMARRQQKINERKQSKFVPKSPEEVQEKAKKAQWLQNIQKRVDEKNPKYIPRPRRQPLMNIINYNEQENIFELKKQVNIDQFLKRMKSRKNKTMKRNKK